jgi:hypothetical protein
MNVGINLLCLFSTYRTLNLVNVFLYIFVSLWSIVRLQCMILFNPKQKQKGEVV